MIADGWYKEEGKEGSYLYYYEHNVLIIKHTYNKTSKKYSGWRIINDVKKEFEDQDLLANIWKRNWSDAKLLPTFCCNAVLYQSPIGNTGNITYNETSTYVGCQIGNNNFAVFK